MTLYDVVEAEELPTFNPTKMIKHVLLSSANVQRFSRIIRSYGRFITVSYFLGAFLYPVVLVTPARIGTIAAVTETALELPVILMVLLSLRADLVLLIATSYDYWFFSTATVVFAITFSLSFRDLRIALGVVRCVGFQMIILIDANAYQPRSLVIGAVLNSALAVLNVAAISFDAVPGIQRRVARQDQVHPPISIQDLLVNSLVTMGILLVRLVFHRHQLIRNAKKKNGKSGGNAKSKRAAVQCVMIRCSIKLRAATNPNLAMVPGVCLASKAAAVGRVQLRRVLNDRMVYNSAETVLSQVAPWHKAAIRTTGTLGIVLTSACSVVMFSTTSTQSSEAIIVLCTGALLATASFAALSFLHYNRRLLAHISSTFDFVFLSIQVTMAHVCVADMLQWRLVAIATFVCVWLWIHWVLTLDALLPETKQRLGISRSRVVVLIVLVTYISGQVALLTVGLLWSHWELRNRVFLNFRLLGYVIEFRVLPFFLSRMMTVTLWTLRLLWRYFYQDDPHKLIMLRGHVEYEYDHHVRFKNAASSSVAPTLTPLATAPSLGGST